MSCTNPSPALLIQMPDGKKKVKFLRHFDTGDYVSLKEKYGDDLLMIPCGKCESCIEKRSRDWAVRCCLEAAEYENNCFLTLTYSPKCLPAKGLSKRDLQRFIKALRNTYGEGIRYFACGEYGEHSYRAHYHLIVFNFFPDDAVKEYANPYGGFYYSSKKLNELWKFGYVSIGDVSYNSCAYVARYCNKKIKNFGREVGVVANPEFCLMSLRPGIGKAYFDKHFESLMATDVIYAQIGDKFKVSSNRYFDKLIERLDPDKLLELKKDRISKSNDTVASELLSRSLTSVEDYLLYQDRLKSEKYNRLKRRI